MSPRRSPQGFTIIELMVVVAVIAVLASLAAPAMRDYLDRQRLITQARAVQNLAQFARSEAIKHSASGDAGAKKIALSVNPGTQWYVGLSNGAACNSDATCVINESATAGGVSHHVSYNECSSCTTMTTPTSQLVVVFDMRGIVTGSTAQKELTLQSPLGRQLTLQINALGRISICSPSGSTTFVNGFPTCS
jgi:prepilin-type N-terminal cleavage/methylation domain-containing protein